MSRSMLLICLGLLPLGCETKPQSSPISKKKLETPSTSKKVDVGPNIWLEVLPDGKRQVIISAEVCLTEGTLELFLTRKGTKEHEAILAADVDARKIHEALLLAGATAGEPVRFAPKFLPPTGTRIEIDVTYRVNDDEVKTLRANEWIRENATKAPLSSDWVFAGSVLADDPFNPNAPKRYLANEGDLIAVANFETAMLDLPIESSKADSSRGFEAWTEKLPPRGTKVAVTLRPIIAAKK